MNRAERRAAAALATDYEAQGRQTGEMLVRIIEGADVGQYLDRVPVAGGTGADPVGLQFDAGPVTGHEGLGGLGGRFCDDSPGAAVQPDPSWRGRQHARGLHDGGDPELGGDDGRVGGRAAGLCDDA